MKNGLPLWRRIINVVIPLLPIIICVILGFVTGIFNFLTLDLQYDLAERVAERSAYPGTDRIQNIYSHTDIGPDLYSEYYITNDSPSTVLDYYRKHFLTIHVVDEGFIETMGYSSFQEFIDSDRRGLFALHESECGRKLFVTCMTILVFGTNTNPNSALIIISYLKFII